MLCVPVKWWQTDTSWKGEKVQVIVVVFDVQDVQLSHQTTEEEGGWKEEGRGDVERYIHWKIYLFSAN